MQPKQPAAKKQKLGKEARTTPKPKGSSFVDCPVCGVQLHHAFILQHAGLCETPQTIANKPTAKPGVRPIAKPARLAGQKGPCLWNDQSVPLTYQAGIAKVTDKVSAKQPVDESPLQKSDQALPASNAFATLMKAGNTKSLRQCFYLQFFADGTWVCSWTKGRKPPPRDAGQAAEVQWEAEVELKEKKGGPSVPMILSTNLLSSASGQSCLSWDSPQLISNQGPRSGRLSPSLLKSTIQKNVRLCRPAPALRSSLHLLKESWTEFLRRAAIVALEDAIMHPALPLLLWLTAAVAKGYQPSEQHAAVCLEAMHELGAVRLRDRLPSGWEEAKAFPSPTIAEADEALQPEEALYVKCLIMRAQFGGMTGDVKMLQSYACIWHQRFSGLLPEPPQKQTEAEPKQSQSTVLHRSTTTSSPWLSWLHDLYRRVPTPPYLKQGCETPKALIDIYAVGPLVFSDVPPSAVDFHCSNIVEDILKDAVVGPAVRKHFSDVFLGKAGRSELAGSPAEGLKRAMWQFRSSINKKVPLLGEENEEGCRKETAALGAVWQEVAAFADQYSRSQIRKRLS